MGSDELMSFGGVACMNVHLCELETIDSNLFGIPDEGCCLEHQLLGLKVGQLRGWDDLRPGRKMGKRVAPRGR